MWQTGVGTRLPISPGSRVIYKCSTFPTGPIIGIIGLVGLR